MSLSPAWIVSVLLGCSSSSAGRMEECEERDRGIMAHYRISAAHTTFSLREEFGV